MIPIPVEIDAMLAILNLPREMGDNGIFKEHQGLVLEMIHSLVLQEHFDRATHDDLPEEEPFLISFRHTLNQIEKLASTLGEGIVKTVGLDQSATELLTGSEIDAFKAKLELRALTGLRDYLNLQGQDRLNELKPRPPRVIRVGVI